MNVETLVAIVIAVIGSNGLWSFIQSRSKHKSAQDRMLLGLGHSEIFRSCNKYIERGGITSDELEDLLIYLYAPYSALGGNGSGEAMVEKCKKLPIISVAEADKLDRERKN